MEASILPYYYMGVHNLTPVNREDNPSRNTPRSSFDDHSYSLRVKLLDKGRQLGWAISRYLSGVDHRI